MHSKFTLLLAAALGFSAAPAVAAPDQSPGMAIMSAVVAGEGALIRGAGATAVAAEGVGVYSVDFVRNVEDCARYATVAGPAGVGIASGQILASFDSPTGNRVEVKTFDASGAASYRSFQLLVFCAE